MAHQAGEAQPEILFGELSTFVEGDSNRDA